MRFPVDVRYGWELDDARHLVRRQAMYSYVLPSYTWSAMLCRFWCQAGNRRKPTLTAQGRAKPTNLLHVMVWIINEAWLNRSHIILGNPHISQIWKNSTLSKVSPDLYEVTFSAVCVPSRRARHNRVQAHNI